jgi:hypothetical protein
MKIEVTWDRPSFKGGLGLASEHSPYDSASYPYMSNPDWGIKGNKIDDPVAYDVNENGYIKEVIELNKTADYGKYKISTGYVYGDFGIIKGKADIYIDGYLKETITGPVIIPPVPGNVGGAYWDIAYIDEPSGDIYEINKVDYMLIIY